MTEKDKIIINLFFQQATHLLDHSLIESGNFHAPHPLERLRVINTGLENFKPPKLDWEPIESLLVRLRNFCNKSDRTYFNKVANILNTYANDDDRDFLRDTKKLFFSKGHFSLATVKINEIPYNEEGVFNLYVNGGLFHDDHDKSFSLAKLKSIIVMPTEELFLSACSNKVRAVAAVHAYLKHHKIAS